MFSNTELIEPIKNPATEIVLFKNWGEDARTEGLPTKNQIQWKQRTDETFRLSCMMKYGRDWAVHLPSLKTILAGKQHQRKRRRAA